MFEIGALHYHNTVECNAGAGHYQPPPDQKRMIEMSDVIDAAVAALSEKLGGAAFEGSAKFVIEGEGAVVIDATGARASDEEADVTLTASVDTFQAIMEGDLNPTAAFMSGRLSVDGDMGMAMRLGSILA